MNTLLVPATLLNWLKIAAPAPYWRSVSALSSHTRRAEVEEPTERSPAASAQLGAPTDKPVPKYPLLGREAPDAPMSKALSLAHTNIPVESMRQEFVPDNVVFVAPVKKSICVQAFCVPEPPPMRNTFVVVPITGKRNRTCSSAAR